MSIGRDKSEYVQHTFPRWIKTKYHPFIKLYNKKYMTKKICVCASLHHSFPFLASAFLDTRSFPAWCHHAAGVFVVAEMLSRPYGTVVDFCIVLISFLWGILCEASFISSTYTDISRSLWSISVVTWSTNAEQVSICLYYSSFAVLQILPAIQYLLKYLHLLGLCC